VWVLCGTEHLGALGTRLAYDMDSSPVIISYGMGSYVANSDDSFMDEEYKKKQK